MTGFCSGEVVFAIVKSSNVYQLIEAFDLSYTPSPNPLIGHSQGGNRPDIVLRLKEGFSTVFKNAAQSPSTLETTCHFV